MAHAVRSRKTGQSIRQVLAQGTAEEATYERQLNKLDLSLKYLRYPTTPSKTDLCVCTNIHVCVYLYMYILCIYICMYIYI